MALSDLAQQIAASAPPVDTIVYGPWRGSMRSRPRDLVPREYMAGGTDHHYLPRTGTWKRRLGQTQKFDTFGAADGLLPAKWNARCRWADEFLSGSLCSDGIPTQIALFTRETIATGLDDGRFSNVWVRDQVANAHYTLCSEFDATQYPVPGSEQRYKVTPLWYDSGDGGITRGATEFSRRFLVSGSRRFTKVGSEIYFPSVLGTPSRWNGEKATATGTKRNVLMPSGPLPPLHAGTLAKGTAADAGEDGPWKGKDRFAWACAYRFEDGSIGAFTVPRLPNAIHTNGYNIFTVDSANPEVSYRSVVYSNLPPLIPGTVALLILRGPKVSYSDGDNLRINPYDMRLVTELRGGVSTYEDTAGADDAIEPDPGGIADGFFIHPKHAMPPRARYNFGGDMRYGHAYGGMNPTALLLAPVGRAADYDLNLASDSASAYAYPASYFIVTINPFAPSGALTLVREDTGADPINVSVAFNLATYDTLQKLVDAINATSFAVNGLQWRAQLAPGVSGEASCITTLTPHDRTLTTCTFAIGLAKVTRAAGGLLKVGVGARVIEAGGGAAFASIPVVTNIVSDTELTLNIAPTANAVTDTDFLFFLGDDPTPGSADRGYQRAVTAALPQAIYFNKTYLNAQTADGTGIEKSTVWLTSASPGSTKSAPNAFVTRLSNRFIPPGRAGICQGGAACDHGFVVPFANQIGAIRFPPNITSGLDRELKLVMLNESEGCVAWNTVVPGNRFVPYLKPSGMYAADLYREILLTEDTWVQSPARGDFDYEMPLCITSAAKDTDDQYAHARIARGVLRLTYRASGTHPNREVDYDFSSGQDANGLAALIDREGLFAERDGARVMIRPPGSVWGWGLPLVRSATVLLEARRSDGTHLYGFNDQNTGATGDGRVDELEVTEQDNGTNISAEVNGPWERGRNLGAISGQEIEVEHSSPAGSVGQLDFHRSYANQVFSFTPTASGTSDVLRDLRLLTLPARVRTGACYLGWRQTSGSARELRSLRLRLLNLPQRRTVTSDTGGV